MIKTPSARTKSPLLSLIALIVLIVGIIIALFLLPDTNSNKIETDRTEMIETIDATTY